jgi:carboxypeptidase Taq
VLRFEIERELIAGKVQPGDLPDLWNAKVKEYLGLLPPAPDVGVLQDIHWSAGLIGYFPTYSLGNLYAAQLFEAAERAMPGLESGFARGELLPLRDWLIENVHSHGSRYRAPELIERATGSPPSAEAFKRYVKRKFEPLYRL